MKKRYSKRRFELEEFESEDKLRKSLSKRTDAPQRHNRNWKRLWLDHPDDFDALDEFFCSR
jgi:hypothetical protein